MKRVAPPVINLVNVRFDAFADACRSAAKAIGETLAPAFARLGTFLAASIRHVLMTPRQLAEEHASSFQTELRTPPSEWPSTPSPRVFGLDRSEW